MEGSSGIALRRQATAGWPMQSESLRIQATIADLAITQDAAQIAALSALTWREIHAILSPVIGPGGVAALYQRSLHVTRSAHPCLGTVREDALLLAEFAALEGVLSQQTSAEAAAANGALLKAFCDLLATLIGVSLTERLLRSVRNFPSSGLAVQDTAR
jgi:hypothetical protein